MANGTLANIFAYLNSISNINRRVNNIYSLLTNLNTTIQELNNLTNSNNTELNQLLRDLSIIKQDVSLLPTNINNVLQYLAESEIEQHHETHIFPSRTDVDVVFTAGAVANTWSAWSEIVDGNNVKFEDKLRLSEFIVMHISSIQIEEANQTGNVYMIEIAYGSPRITITRLRYISGAQAKLEGIQQMRIRADFIPRDKKLYYRCMAETGGATCNVSIRYHLHDLE